jgi:Tol biopolymer transport system component
MSPAGQPMRAALVGLALAAATLIGSADAVIRESGSILFYGSRAPDYYAEIYSVAADGSGRTNLTRAPAADEGSAVSPDGRRVAFVSQRDGFDALYVMQADGSGQHQLVGRLFTTPYRIGRLVWSPTGRHLAFKVTQPPVGSLFETSTQYVVDLQSGRHQLLGGTGCSGEAAAFSPDGRLVAFTVASCRPVLTNVMVARADGRAARSVGSGSLAGWSSHGQRLLLLRRTRNPNIQNVATVDAFGRKPWVLGGGVTASAAAWSPNGRLIAFARAGGRRAGVYVVRPGGGRARQLVRLPKVSSIRWSPNGTWLALSVAPVSRQGVVRIHVSRSNGKGLRRVADARTHPVWSRNSRQLAFIGHDGGARVVSPQGSSTRRIIDPSAEAIGTIAWGIGDRLFFDASGTRSTYLLAVEPDGSRVRHVGPEGGPVGRISQDGSRVAFVRGADIWTARLDRSDERQLTSGAELDAAPAWSPDGRKIAFVRRAGSTSDIFVVESSGGAARQLTRHDLGENVGAPAWSPDGTRIAFPSFGGLVVIHSDGSGRRFLSTLGGRAFGDPDWSPDGTRIALGGCAIAVLNADGRGYRELTGSGVREGQPSWSPDGRKIVFVRSAVPCAGDLSGDSDLWTINPDGTGKTRLTDGPWPDTLPSWRAVEQ